MFQRWLLFILILGAAPCQAMIIVGFEGEPFYFKNGTEGVAGGCYEIMQRFCEKEKLHCKFKIAPLPKVLEMIKDGSADATCPLSVTEERKKFIGFTNEIFKTHFAFFGLPETAKKVSTMKDLGKLSVSAFAPSRVYESLDELRETSPTKFEIIKETSNISTLLRAEKISKVLAYINHEIGVRWIEKTHSKLIEAPLIGESLYYNIGFAKKNYSNEKISKYIQSIQDVITDSEMKESITKMGLTLWEPPLAKPSPTVSESPIQ
jgi:ABC-type amino acid transport substrate-binding protein